ncbi:MAG: amino-acid N-acetyltransferase [Verrucomicrobia bacterium]|nr:amino-acid N-acetyltransferase [Verrucomicrobiota bacterium]
MKLTDLRGILQYIPRFRQKVFILSLDGAIVADENFANILLDIALLRSLNIRVVLVHGAAAQIQALSEQLRIAPTDLDGRGVTDAKTLKLALTAANQVTHEIMEGLSTNDLRAAVTNAVIARPVGIIQGVDQQFTGKVERVDIELLQTLLESRIIPVVPPVCFDGDGNTYRVNSDAVAVAVAEALKAAKLIYMTTRDGLIRQGKLIHQIQVDELTDILENRKQELEPEGISKATYGAAACRAGVPRVHVINGRVDEGLLAEIFSNEGIGTLIHASEYQQIRRALKKDIRNILTLIKTSVASEELVKRTRATIEKQLGDYYIFEIDRNPVACVALHRYPEQRKGELACLYVHPSHENQGIGKKLVSFVEEKARELGFDEIITMSTQTFTYFQSKSGFTEGTPDDLPPSRREKYAQSGRNSKVLVKKVLRTSSAKPQRSVE